MIELKVEEYCHNCPSFEPESSTTTTHLTDSLYNPWTGETIPGKTIINTIVTCKYRRRCAAMFRYLQRCGLNKEGHSNEQN